VVTELFERSSKKNSTGPASLSNCRQSGVWPAASLAGEQPDERHSKVQRLYLKHCHWLHALCPDGLSQKTAADAPISANLLGCAFPAK